MRTLESLLAIALATGCGNVHTPDTSSDPPPDASPDSTPPSDASPDAPAAATTITLSVAGTPALLAYRDGLAAPWQLPTPTGPNTYSMSVHGPYIVTIVCDDHKGSTGVEQLARTLDDERTIADFLCETPTFATITGHMAQPGTVAVGFFSDSSQAASGFDFSVFTTTGKHDLLAATDTRIAIRPGIDVQHDVAITPAIDMTREGQPLVPITLRASNVSDESLNAHIHVVTSTTSLPLPNSGMATFAAPSLSSSMKQTVEVSASGDKTRRSTSRESFRVGDSVDFVMPDPVRDVKFVVSPAELSARWAPVTDFEHVVFGLYGTLSNGFMSVEINQSRSFLRATGNAAAIVDTDVPGFQPQWADPVSVFQRSVFVYGSNVTGSTESSFTETGTDATSMNATDRRQVYRPRRGPRGLRVEP